MPRCPNCSAELIDEYCSSCGQARIHPQDLSARHFVLELADEIVNVHSKFKILRSLRGLFTPGFLTTEYPGRPAPVSSHSHQAVSGLRRDLLPVAAPGRLQARAMVEEDPTRDFNWLVSARVAERGLDPSLFSARFDVRVQSIYTICLGAGAIVIAVLLQLLFRKQAWPVRRPSYLRPSLRVVHVSHHSGGRR